MPSEMPYEEIARDAIAGKQVVFCASLRQADEHKKAIAAAARRLGARHVVAPRRDWRVDVGNAVVRLVLTNGLDGRGAQADVAYLGSATRMQHELAALMGAQVK